MISGGLNHDHVHNVLINDQVSETIVLVQDNLTGLIKFAVLAQGHTTQGAEVL